MPVKKAVKGMYSLHDSDATLQAILENTAACVFAKDLQGRYIIANPSFVQLFGWAGIDAVLGKTDGELHPADVAESYIANDRLVLAMGRPLEFEETAALPDGTRTYLMLKFPLRDRSGTIFGVCGIATDITERRKSEQEHQRLLLLEQAARADAEAAERRYRELVDGLDAIVWEADARTWQFTYVSRRAEQLLGYPVERWMSEAGFWASIIHPEDRDFAINYCKTACALCLDHDFTYRAVAADERTLWLRDIVYVVKGVDGKPSHLRGVMIDVSETKRLQMELEQRAHELAKADRHKDEFLATLAHELRNPLAPMRNAIGLMRMARDNVDIRDQAMEVMERQLEQMVHLIDDLLDVSRISRGKIQLRTERVELSAIIQNALESSEPSIKAGAHALTVELPNQPIYLDGDATRLSQVFSNLLTNAAKYTEAGGQIRLAAERQGREVCVSVRDSGIGIALDDLPRLFEMFSQIGPAVERSQGGLGIGLSLVKAIVDMHGGRVSAASAGIGHGSEFFVWLPVAAQGDGRPQSSGKSVAASQPCEPCRILVVDDNRDSAETLGMLLGLSGNQVAVAHDGPEALRIAAEFRPQLVLLDIGMPKMSGYRVATEIRRHTWGREMQLVAMTGWGQEEDKRRALEAGFDQHLTKPVSSASLTILLTNLRRS